MKNVKESMLKKAIFIVLEEFEKLVSDLTGTTAYHEDGYISLEDGVREKLEEYFDVSITSIHADGFDVAGVWIVYREDAECL